MIDQCILCPPGHYCSADGLTKPSGLCEAGYFCSGGSDVATPFSNGVKVQRENIFSGQPCSYIVNDTSNIFCQTYTGLACSSINNDTVNANDICPPGHYCRKGSSTPQSCPPGTNASAIGLQNLYECTSCKPGFYCPNNGTVFATLVCPVGYFCKAGTYSLGDNNICPFGAACPLGSHMYKTCPKGTYQNQTGQGSCNLCPAGYLCNEATIKYSIPCPVGKFCVEGSYVGSYCANGTYSLSLNLKSQSECMSCLPGKYCVNGMVAGNCTSGYFCKSNQGSPTPYVNIAKYPNPTDLLNFIESQLGAPCPPGFYCPHGTSIPISCPFGTTRVQAYGEKKEDCGSCPLGYLCTAGNPIPTACSVGDYCPEGSSAINCPKGTYNPVIAQFSLDNCTNCPAGYFCNSTAISKYERWPCPKGHYCLMGTLAPLPCAAGTFRNKTGAASQYDCKVCPGGEYCALGSVSYVECPAGYFCPEGSANITICPPGFVCKNGTATPKICPSSQYCPIGSKLPISCYLGTYCPAGTDFPIPCPLGYKAATGATIFSSIETACEVCPGGYYGTDPQRLQCYLGAAGYYYRPGAKSATPSNLLTQNGSVCPGGSYCPAGSSVPQPCLQGYYQPNLGAVNQSQCSICLSNTYQPNNGSQSCYKCSSSSRSSKGSVSCSCVGKNRVFQPTDGWCVCKPGFEFVDSNYAVSSTGDGAYDCQPIVYSRCAQSQIRLHDGTCASDGYCNTLCGVQGGKISSGAGVLLLRLRH